MSPMLYLSGEATRLAQLVESARLLIVWSWVRSPHRVYAPFIFSPCSFAVWGNAATLNEFFVVQISLLVFNLSNQTATDPRADDKQWAAKSKCLDYHQFWRKPGVHLVQSIR